MKIRATQAIMECLLEQGVDTVFGYPGGTILNVYDELYRYQDRIRHILTAHEQGAAHAADGYARSTGKVGVCFATSGPGATNLTTGIATAYLDSSPVVFITCNVGENLLGKDAFQEVDITGIAMPITKATFLVRDARQIPDVMRQAFAVAATGRPGPVLIDLPKDVMGELGDAEYPEEVNIRGYKPNTHVHIGQLKRALKMLGKAKRPLFLAGGGVNVAHAQEAFTELVECTHVPVVTTVMGRGAIPTNHPLYIGNLGMHGAYASNMSVNECDLLFSIGTRFNDRITGKLHSFAPKAQIVHIDIDTAAISKNVQVDVPIVADAKEAIDKMLEYVTECDTEKWRAQVETWKEEHPMKMKRKPIMTPQDVIDTINKVFDAAIIVTDVGQHQMFTAQFIEITHKKQLLMSGGLGTMGYGLPGAIGAKIGNPDTPVISISGDGGMQMNIQELATAVLEELPIISCIFNNNNLGMVRQGKCGEVPCPEYTPNFLKLAESYGAKGIHVSKVEEIEPAFREAMQSKKTPYIIEFDIDPEDLVYPMIQPGGTLEDMIMDC